MSGSKTAFVTGGTGFIGSHLVEALLANGYTEVRCLVRSRLKWLDTLDITPVYGDLHDLDALREGCEHVDYVYHVAGVTGTKEALTWDEFVAGNVTATTNLLEVVAEVAPAVRKVLVTSSLAVVGEADVYVATEETPLNPISLYGRSKAEMERAIQPVMDQVPVVVVRPPAVYGPREADIYAFFQTVSRGVCPIVGSGKEPELSLVHGRDLALGMMQAAEHEDTAGQTYFIGSDRPYTWNEIKAATVAALGSRAFTVHIPRGLVQPLGTAVEWAGKLVGQHTPLNREKAREIRYACTACSSDKARQEFGYAPQTALDAGIRETIAWYRAEDWL